MAKIRLIGKVVTKAVTGTIGQNNTKFSKYLVQVSIGGQISNNPRLAQNATSNAKNSFFAVMAFGKQAEYPIQAGTTIELDGSLEIADFQLDTSVPAKQAAIINPSHTTILQGNVIHYAKAYNLLGNLVKNDAEIYTPQSGKNIYNQKVAVGKKIGEQEFTSYYGIKLFGERGQKLSDKQLLNKAKVKSILVDGSISATYTQKEQADGTKKEYFNVDINVDDFQIASWASNGSEGQTNNQSNSQGQAISVSNNAYTNNGKPESIMNDTNLDDIDLSEIPF